MTLDISDKDVGLERNLVRSSRYGLQRLRSKLNQKFIYVMRKYMYLVPKEYRDEILKITERFGDFEEVSLIKACKDLSVVALRNWFFSGDRRYVYLLDWHVLLGYDTVLHREVDFTDFDVFITKQQPEDLVLQGYTDAAITNIGVKNNGLNFKQFISFRDPWSVGGTSTEGKKLEFVVTDRFGKSKILKQNDKFANLLTYSDQDIYDACMSSTGSFVRTFVKADEPARARLVQSYDTWSFIRCSYIESFIKDYNSSGLWTSMGFGNKKTMDLYLSLLSMDGVRLAVDQSGFDLHQSKELVISTAERLFSYLIAKSKSKDLERVCAVELACLRNVRMEFSSYGKSGKWEFGLLSGYKFTALLGSILNMAAFNYACDRLGYRIKYSCFQGDDAVAVMYSTVDREAIAEIYAEIGKKVNVLKTWVSDRRTDYLHLLFDRDKMMVRGYPSRICKSLIWNKPGFSETYNKIGKLNELVSLLLKGERRGLINMTLVLKRHMISNFDLPVSDIENWIFSSSLVNGAGFGNLLYGMRSSSEFNKRRFVITVKGSEHLDKIWFKGFSDYLVFRYKDSLPFLELSGRLKSSNINIHQKYRWKRLGILGML